MLPFLAAVALAFGAIFVAEFGDKSQLLILAFATRYAARPVVLGLVLAAATIQGVSVGIGAVAGAALPDHGGGGRLRRCLPRGCCLDVARGRRRRG